MGGDPLSNIASPPRLEDEEGESIMEKFLTEEEVSKMLNVTCAKLRLDRYKKRGLPFIKMNNTVRYSSRDIERYVNYIKKLSLPEEAQNPRRAERGSDLVRGINKRKWSQEQVEQIRELREDKQLTFQKIAEMLGVTRGTITGVYHRHIKGYKYYPKYAPSPPPQEENKNFFNFGGRDYSWAENLRPIYSNGNIVMIVEEDPVTNVCLKTYHPLYKRKEK